MYNISLKYKQFWFFLLKLSIVTGAFVFVYRQTVLEDALSLEQLTRALKVHLLGNKWIVPSLLFLSLLNWLLEIYKWQVLVHPLRSISFKTAAVQSLSAHTLAILTPFKAGEYAGKAVYYPKNIRTKILLLSFIGNLAQLVVTVFFGIIGVLYFVRTYHIQVYPVKIRFIAALLAMLLFGVLVKNAKIPYGKKGSYLQRAWLFFNKTSRKIKGKVLGISTFRYLIFSHQFYYLLFLFHAPISYESAMMLIFSMYLLATFFPVMNLFDFVIKGSVAIYLFTFAGIDEVLIMTLTTLMWILNFALPALLGAYFVLVFKREMLLSGNL